jgi:hypothetical protein
MKSMTIDLTDVVSANKEFRKRVVDMSEADMMKAFRLTLSQAKMLKHQALIFELKESN